MRHVDFLNGRVPMRSRERAANPLQTLHGFGAAILLRRLRLLSSLPPGGSQGSSPAIARPTRTKIKTKHYGLM